MPKTTNPKGRNNYDSFVMLHRWEIRSTSYRSLSVYARAGLIELLLRYNGLNNGEISMSARQMAKALGCGKNKGNEVLRELEAMGWIKCRSKGRFDSKFMANPEIDGAGRASTWILTGRQYQGKLPTKDYMRWKP